MKTLPSILLIVMVSIMVCAGCSVKEDRSLCPCILVLDFSEVDTAVINSSKLIMAADDGFLFTDELEADEMLSERSFFVPRTELELGVWSGVEGMMNDNGLLIPMGEDCPCVYFHAAVVDTDCEKLHEKVIMRKNHCRMTVNMERDADEIWIVNLYGNVNGYLSDGTPSAGEFSHELQQVGDNEYHSVLPRQIDDSLVMEIDDGSGVLKRFALGEYIAECGYDWTAPDLEDITVEVDVAFTGLTLMIGGWDGDHKFDIVI